MAQPADDYRVGRGRAGAPRWISFAVVTFAYVLGAAAAGLVVLVARSLHPIPLTLAADVAATVAVFAVSMAVANSSAYDPYWSVAPPVVAVVWSLIGTGVGARQVLVIALILIWAIRLTVHWGGTWRGLGHEDWRYVELRDRTRGRLPWWLVSLVGIQLMPTLVVFLGLLSVWPAVAVGTRPLNLLDLAAVAVTGGAIAIEAMADIQLRRFVADPANRGRTADRGLWRLSRHPNYLGEVTFWWGLWLFGLAAAPGWWWTVVGPLAMVVLFLTASVPLMDQRNLARRPDYGVWMRTVPALLPSLRRPTPRPGDIQ